MKKELLEQKNVRNEKGKVHGTSVRSSEREQMEALDCIRPLIHILRERREELKISQTELARRAGVSESYIVRLENNEIDPLLSSLVHIVSALGLALVIH